MSELNAILFQTCKESIFNIVLHYYNIRDKNTLLARNRKRPFPEARYMLMRGLFLIGMSEKEVVLEIARDRTTILHGIEIINNLEQTDLEFRKNLSEIDDRFDGVKNIFKSEIIKKTLQNASGNKNKPENETMLLLYADKGVFKEISDWLQVQPKSSLTSDARELLKTMIANIES
jgi:hypothetical protein